MNTSYVESGDPLAPQLQCTLRVRIWDSQNSLRNTEANGGRRRFSAGSRADHLRK